MRSFLLASSDRVTPLVSAAVAVVAVATVLGGVGTPTALSAQSAWDAPALVSPSVPSGASIFLTNPHGGDLGGLVTFRHAAGPVGLGYRVGIADQQGGDGVSVAGGIDFSGFLARAVDGSEIDVMWWSGVGASLGDATVVSFPLGAVLGWSGGGDGVTLSPYAGGHLALDIAASNDSNDVNLGGSFDLGVDLQLSSGLLVRFGGTFGDREALAIGARIGS